MRSKKSFEAIGETKHIFAVGFDVVDGKGETGADIHAYIELNDISTKIVMEVIGDVMGRLIHDTAKSEETRSAMLKILVANVVKSMDGDEKQPEKEENDDVSIKDISDTLNSIKSLLEVMKMVKEG